jgi:hypothetical protein
LPLNAYLAVAKFIMADFSEYTDNELFALVTQDNEFAFKTLYWRMQFPHKLAIIETITDYMTAGNDMISVGISPLSLSSKLTKQQDFKGSLKQSA